MNNDTQNINDMSEFFQWFFITSTAISKDGLEVTEFVNKVVENGERDEKGELNGNYKFKIFVNDIEVDPFTAISELQKQFDNVVIEKAMKIVEQITKDKLNNLHNQISEIETIVEEKINLLKNEYDTNNDNS